MSSNIIQQPYTIMLDPTGGGGKAKPIANGYFWYGQIDHDPKITPTDVFYKDESGTEFQLKQPLRTNSSGTFIDSLSGNIIQPYTRFLGYSVLIMDKSQSKIIYSNNSVGDQGNVSSLVDAKFDEAKADSTTKVNYLANSIFSYSNLAVGNDWTAAFNKALTDHDHIDIGDLSCEVTNLSIAVGKTISTSKRATILANNSTIAITDPNRAYSDAVGVYASFIDILTLANASDFSVGDEIIIGYRNETGENPIIKQAFDLDEWGYNSQLTKIVAINGNDISLQDRTMFPIKTGRAAWVLAIPKVETAFKGDITFKRNANKSIVSLQSRSVFEGSTFDGAGGVGNIVNGDSRALCRMTDFKVVNFTGGGSGIAFNYGALHNTFTRMEARDYSGTDALLIFFNGSNNNTVDSPNCLTHDPSATGTYGGVCFHAKSWGNTLIGGRFSGGARGMGLFYGAHDNEVIGTHFSNHSESDIFAFYVDGGAKFSMCTFSSAKDGFNHVYADTSKNIDFNMCKFNGLGVKTLALEWRRTVGKLDVTCCFTYTGCEFINSQFYLNYSANGLSWDNCEFQFTPAVGYQFAIKSFKGEAATSYNGWSITNTKFDLCYLDLEGLSFSKICNSNEFDGGDASTAGAAIRLSKTGVCNEVAFNKFANYDSIVSIGSLQAATASVHDNITESVTNGDKCTGANATNNRPNPGVALPPNWKVYPQKQDPTANRTVDYYRAKANGATDETQFAIVAVSES